MKRANEFLTAAADTFKERNAQYGDNWTMVGEVMKGLFPNGVTLNTTDDWNRMHILLLKLVKLTRYTVNWNKGGHADSIRDDTVYGAMLESIDEEIRSRASILKPGMVVTNEYGIPISVIVTTGLNPGSPESDKTIHLCKDCNTPLTCRAEQKCLKISTIPCNDCATREMCTQEHHCDRVSNGYR